MLCSKCSKDKEETDFAWKKQVKQIRHKICKQCHISYSKKHYKDNSTTYIQTAKKNSAIAIKRNKAWIITYLTENPCIDCGEEDIDILEFDHREMRPKHRVAHLLKGSLETLKAEVDKCEARCADCHTKRTRIQLGITRVSASVA